MAIKKLASLANSRIISSIGVAILLTGCSSGMPQECTDYMEKMNAMTENMTGVAPMTGSNMERLEEEWDKLSDAEKEQATQACKQGLEQIEQMEKMLQ